MKTRIIILLILCLPAWAKAALPPFVVPFTNENSILTVDRFYNFVTPIVQQQQAELREITLDASSNSTSLSDDTNAKSRARRAYLSALRALNLESHEEALEQFITNVYTLYPSQRVQAGCLHYFRSIGTLRENSLAKIQTFAESGGLNVEHLDFFFVVFERDNLGDGLVELPLNYKFILFDQFLVDYSSAKDLEQKMVKSVHLSDLLATLVSNKKLQRDKKTEVIGRAYSIAFDLFENGHIDEARSFASQLFREVFWNRDGANSELANLFFPEVLKFFKTASDGGESTSLGLIAMELYHLVKLDSAELGSASSLFSTIRELFLEYGDSESAKAYLSVALVPALEFLNDREVSELSSIVERMWMSEVLSHAERYRLSDYIVAEKTGRFDLGELLFREAKKIKDELDLITDEEVEEYSEVIGFLMNSGIGLFAFDSNNLKLPLRQRVDRLLEFLSNESNRVFKP